MFLNRTKLKITCHYSLKVLPLYYWLNCIHHWRSCQSFATLWRVVLLCILIGNLENDAFDVTHSSILVVISRLHFLIYYKSVWRYFAQEWERESKKSHFSNNRHRKIVIYHIMTSKICRKLCWGHNQKPEKNICNLPNLFEFNFQLRSKFEEVSDEPKEMWLVHGWRRVGQQLFVKTHDETGVTLEEEVDRELF